MKKIRDNSLFKKYRSVLGIIILFSFLYSCRTTKRVANTGKANKIPVKEIVQNHNSNKLDFNTIRGRLKISYDDGDQSQSHSLSFRIKKDEAIWMSATLSLAKIYITPDRVSFYLKLQNEYFDGDFSYLSDLLGTELDFEKLQNMLLGESIFNLEKEPYKASVVGNNYQLKPSKDFRLFKRLFLIEPSNYKMALQQISQPQEQRILNINYEAYQKIEDKIFPENILIVAEEEDSKVKIKIDYKNVEFNQRVSFPYRIPKGYKEIRLK